MNTSISKLVTHLQRFVQITEKEKDVLTSLVQIKSVTDKEYLLTEGKVCNSKYFIIQGCVRKYINHPSGEKQIIQFAIENWWITDYTSLEKGVPTGCNIQAVEDSIVAVLDKDSMEQLFKSVPAVERYFRLVLQRAYEASLTRLYYIFSYSGEERYFHFTRSFPEFVQRVPQYMLASYLGLTPQFISKIRGRKSP
jgi:CRP-like cAMP-binding protein